MGRCEVPNEGRSLWRRSGHVRGVHCEVEVQVREGLLRSPGECVGVSDELRSLLCNLVSVGHSLSRRVWTLESALPP